MTKRFKKFFKITLFQIFFITFLFAQPKEFQFERLGIEDGLSQSSVDCMVQDSKGFMWFGTTDGLNRYDGYDFTVFRNDPADTSSLSNSWIWDIYEDNHKILWVATWRGLNKYSEHEQKFSRYLPNPDVPHSLSGTRPTSI